MGRGFAGNRDCARSRNIVQPVVNVTSIDRRRHSRNQRNNDVQAGPAVEGGGLVRVAAPPGYRPVG